MSLISEKRAPALRFKDEQGRDYPEWEHKRLGELYDITSSKRVFQSEWKDSGVPFYRAREIIELSNNGFVDNDLFISPEMYKRYSEKYGAPKQNDLLITGVGTIGKLYIVPKNSTFYIKDGNIIWLKDKKLVSGVFVKYLFLTRYIEKQLFDNASITTVATYTIESAKKTKVLLPVVEEQQKIAAFLSAVDTKIEQLNGKKSLLEQYKKGMMQKLLSQEIRFKDEGGRDYPDWESHSLDKIATVTMGTSPASAAYNQHGVGLPLIQGNADIKNRKSIPRVYTSIITKECLPNDTLLSVRAPVGEVSRSDHHACIGRGIASIRARDAVVRQTFLYNYLVWHEPKWRSISQGSTFEAVNSNDIRSLRVKVPSKSEQQKIADFLSSVDSKIDLVADQIEKTRYFKQGLVQQMFI